MLRKKARPGATVKVIRLNMTHALHVRGHCIELRGLSSVGTLLGPISRHKGKAWWVEHDDGLSSVAPYWLTELELIG